MIELIVAFVAAVSLTLILIPLAGKIAPRVGLVDAPDERRKLHGRSIPLIGGIVVFFVSTVVFGTLVLLRGDLFGDGFGLGTGFRFSDHWHAYLGLFLASGFLLGVGVLDDRFGIRGRQKLLGQIFACTILIMFGYHDSFRSISFGSLVIEFGDFGVVIVYFWLLGAINSVNLLDGADGFATTIGVIMGLALCFMAWKTGHWIDAIFIGIFTGTLVGFLKYNFPPAKVFLGDAGSMLIGLVFAVMAIRCSVKEAGVVAFFAPVALLAIPMIDTLAAILRRRLTGRSIYAVDRAHLHHTLARRGYGPVISLLILAGLCLITAVGASLAINYNQSQFAVGSVVLVAVLLISTRIFGFAEFQLVSARLMSTFKSFVEMGEGKESNARHSSIQLQGVRDWQVIWKRLVTFADAHDFKELRLDLHLPWIHESFHATYNQKEKKFHDGGEEWSAGVPIYVQRRVSGRIDVVAYENRKISPYSTMNELVALLESLEPSFIEIMHSMDNVDAIAKQKRIAKNRKHSDAKKNKVDPTGGQSPESGDSNTDSQESQFSAENLA